MNPTPFWHRWLRVRWYLRMYNNTLRHCRSAKRTQAIIQLLNSWWERFSEAERKFILSREQW